jgi:hypothetical protein
VTTRSASCFILFLSVSACVGLPADGGAQSISPPVLVLLRNDADVPPAVVARAQAEVVRLYGLIGVEVTWVTKVPEPGRRLRIVSLVAWEPPDPRIPESVLGVTNAGRGERGILAYVFWRRVEHASLKFTASLHHVLAIAMAHELGHMLLPDGSHAKRGLMEESWNSGHFRVASAGLLHFADDSAELIRRGLIAETSLAQRADRRRP